MSSGLPGRLRTPGVEAAIGDHEERIRALERSPGGQGGDLEAFWWGNFPPLAVGPAGGIWTVPFIEGDSVTWEIVRTYFRFESPSGVGTYTIQIEKSPPGAFVPTVLDSLSLAAGVNDVTHTGTFGLVVSGDLLRLNWVAIGSNARNFTVQAEGTLQ